jgi:hypothetical protein
MGALTVVDAALAVALAARVVDEAVESHPAEGAHIAD